MAWPNDYTVTNSEGVKIRFSVVSGAPFVLPDTDISFGLPTPMKDFDIWLRCDCCSFSAGVFPTPPDGQIPEVIHKQLYDHAARCEGAKPSNVIAFPGTR